MNQKTFKIVAIVGVIVIVVLFSVIIKSSKVGLE